MLLSGCFAFRNTQPTPQAVQTQNKGSDFSALYNHSMSIVNPQVSVFVENQNTAKVFFKIKTNELKNALASTNDSISLVVKSNLRNAENFQLVDTTSLKFDFAITNTEYVSGQFSLNIPAQANYKLLMNFMNLRYNINKRILLNINNMPPFNEAKYLIKTIEGEILHGNVVTSGQQVIISACSDCGVGTNIEFYKQQPYITFPPYLLLQGKNRTDPVEAVSRPDTTFYYNFNDTLALAEPGFYALGSTLKNEKFGIVVSDNAAFPNITTVEAMAEPLKMLITDREYNKIQTADNQKIVVDSLWLSFSKSEKKAKEQIRVFYNRVAKANVFFSHTVEGWKTDRGMIYVMFGPPTVVNITQNTEEWTYGDLRSGVTFVFNNYSGISNDYKLERANTFQAIWQQVVSTWRLGRIFTITKIDNE